MDQKSIGIVSYITIIGWIIALVSYNGSAEKSSLAKFHLRQSFGIFATGFVLWIVMMILGFMFIWIMPAMLFAIPVLWFAIGISLFVFWIIGLIAAINGEEKLVPIAGTFYQKTFSFIN